MYHEVHVHVHVHMFVLLAKVVYSLMCCDIYVYGDPYALYRASVRYGYTRHLFPSRVQYQEKKYKNTQRILKAKYTPCGTAYWGIYRVLVLYSTSHTSKATSHRRVLGGRAAADCWLRKCHSVFRGGGAPQAAPTPATSAAAVPRDLLAGGRARDGLRSASSAAGVGGTPATPSELVAPLEVGTGWAALGSSLGSSPSLSASTTTSGSV